MAKIICIEDEEHIRDDLVEELTDAGHHVIPACNGAEGLQAIWENQPDLVICDFLMPKMNGGQVFQKLKDEYPNFQDLPFVFLSAHADKQSVENGVTMDADIYLTKPVNFDVLIETVTGLLAKKNKTS